MNQANQPNNPRPRFKLASVLKWIGILFIVAAIVLVIIYKCPTKSLQFGIYTLTGVGFALLFAKSAEKSKVKFPIKNFNIVLYGSVGLPFALFIIDPIGTFKPDECSLSFNKTTITVLVHDKTGKQDKIF